MHIKKHIPNALTSLNLACGFIASIQVFEGALITAAWLIILAALFDFSDGTAARLLNARSEMGKQLDSLADLISFGVAPALILFQLLHTAFSDVQGNVFMQWIPYLAVLIPIFSALRLAHFNIDTRQVSSFIGLPTPANALLYVSIPLIAHYQPLNILGSFYSAPWFLTLLAPLSAWMLVSPLPLLGLKFTHLGWQGNQQRYLLLGIGLVLLLLFQFAAIPLIILVYVLLSLTGKSFSSTDKQ